MDNNQRRQVLSNKGERSNNNTIFKGESPENSFIQTEHQHLKIVTTEERNNESPEMVTRQSLIESTNMNSPA